MVVYSTIYPHSTILPIDIPMISHSTWCRNNSFKAYRLTRISCRKNT